MLIKLSMKKYKDKEINIDDGNDGPIITNICVSHSSPSYFASIQTINKPAYELLVKICEEAGFPIDKAPAALRFGFSSTYDQDIAAFLQTIGTVCHNLKSIFDSELSRYFSGLDFTQEYKVSRWTGYGDSRSYFGRTNKQILADDAILTTFSWQFNCRSCFIFMNATNKNNYKKIRSIYDKTNLKISTYDPFLQIRIESSSTEELSEFIRIAKTIEPTLHTLSEKLNEFLELGREAMNGPFHWDQYSKRMISWQPFSAYLKWLPCEQAMPTPVNKHSIFSISSSGVIAEESNDILEDFIHDTEEELLPIDFQ